MLPPPGQDVTYKGRPKSKVDPKIFAVPSTGAGCVNADEVLTRYRRSLRFILGGHNSPGVPTLLAPQAVLRYAVGTETRRCWRRYRGSIGRPISHQPQGRATARPCLLPQWGQLRCVKAVPGSMCASGVSYPRVAGAADLQIKAGLFLPGSGPLVSPASRSLGAKTASGVAVSERINGDCHAPGGVDASLGRHFLAPLPHPVTDDGSSSSESMLGLK